MHEFPSFHAERLRSGAPIRGPRRSLVPPSSGQIMQSSARRAPDQWKSETMQIAGAGPVPEFRMRFIRGRVAPARIPSLCAKRRGERNIFKSAARRLELESAASRRTRVCASEIAGRCAAPARTRRLGRKYSNLDRASDPGAFVARFIWPARSRAPGDRRDVILHK